MTYTSRTHQRPACLKVSRPATSLNLIVKGQGVVLFKATQECRLTFCDISGTIGLCVQFTDKAVQVHLEPSHEPLVDKTNTQGLSKAQGAYYWFSLDAQNQRLVGGVGEPRKETAVYTFQIAGGNSTKKFLEGLVCVNGENLQFMTLLRDPITKSVPLLVKNTEELTMDLIAEGSCMPKVNLPSTSQKLYDCIAGKHFVLNTPDFPEFTQAIEKSIATPGKWCYEKLKEKATEFDKDKPDEKETYLRITLGENNGESPGIPYVMEIWPVGHYSPVHNHAGATAIIRVLHGAIHVSLFPFLSEDTVAPFAKGDFKQGDITWITPSLNQIHQLKNLDGKKDTCITIQCYMYEDTNTQHYDYFDYIDASHQQQQFDPNSDMDFVDFKKTMRREWLEAQGQQEPKGCFSFFV
jgi:hypothetical protein